MLTIQEVGSEILSNEPKHFYVFTGSEYGIKEKYIDILTNHYGKVTSVDSISELLGLMQKKHFIPLTPQLYVVRYDDDFIRNLGDESKNEISNTNIVGTIVCIYEDSKSSTKLEKYLSDYTVNIGHVDDKFVFKYLKLDFPNIPDRLISVCVKLGSNYGHSKNIARCMSRCDVNELFELSDYELSELFGANLYTTDSDIKLGFASRNFKQLLDIINKYEGNLDSILYNMMSTLVELEKIHYNKYCESDIRKYSDKWQLEDIYNMFMQIYRELERNRSVNSNISNSLVYLAALTQFRVVPDVEVL